MYKVVFLPPTIDAKGRVCLTIQTTTRGCKQVRQHPVNKGLSDYYSEGETISVVDIMNAISFHACPLFGPHRSYSRLPKPMRKRIISELKSLGYDKPITTPI